ncbi:MAG: hypothetical protein ACXVI9_08680 [Mucilaginibacter sp.]
MKIFSFILTGFLLFISCDHTILTKNDRKKLKKELSNKEINVGRNGEILHISCYHDNHMITFSFKDKQLIEQVIKDSLTNKISKTIQDSLYIEAEHTMKLITKYSILSSTEKFKNAGIPLKLYMKDRSIYLYCPDTLALKDDYISYIRNSKFIDSGWYYKKQD